jgi:hypothetical protein
MTRTRHRCRAPTQLLISSFALRRVQFNEARGPARDDTSAAGLVRRPTGPDRTALLGWTGLDAAPSATIDHALRSPAHTAGYACTLAPAPAPAPAAAPAVVVAAVVVVAAAVLAGATTAEPRAATIPDSAGDPGGHPGVGRGRRGGLQVRFDG